MNPTSDCVKAVLLSIKELLNSGEFGIDEIVSSSYCEKYNKSDIDCSIKYLKTHNYIKADIIFADDGIYDVTISAITHKGYEFIK